MKAYLRKLKQEEIQLQNEVTTGWECEPKYTNEMKIEMLDIIPCSESRGLPRKEHFMNSKIIRGLQLLKFGMLM